MNLTDNQTKVRDALPTGESVAPTAIADATRLGYSTVTRLLRELADAGVAVKGSDGWRRANDAPTKTADTNPVDLDETAAGDSTPQPEPDPDPQDDTSEPQPTDDPQPEPAVYAEPEPEPYAEPEASTEPEPEPEPLKSHAEADPEVEAELAQEADASLAEPELMPDDDGQEPVADAISDDPSRTDVDLAAEPEEEADTSTADDSGDAAPRAPRLRKGQLRDQVLDVLREAKEPLGPTQLSKLLNGKSQGAISNALDRLVQDGAAELTNEKPRRFSATSTT